MANYEPTTVSEGGEIKKGMENKVLKIMEKYKFGCGDLNVELNKNIEIACLNVWGYESPCAYKPFDIDCENDVFCAFLDEIKNYLKTPLIISEIGHEKCRYVQAYALIVRPKRVVVCVSLQDAINKELK